MRTWTPFGTLIEAATRLVHCRAPPKGAGTVIQGCHGGLVRSRYPSQKSKVSFAIYESRNALAFAQSSDMACSLVCSMSTWQGIVYKWWGKDFWTWWLGSWAHSGLTGVSMKRTSCLILLCNTGHKTHLSGPVRTSSISGWRRVLPHREWIERGHNALSICIYTW